MLTKQRGVISLLFTAILLVAALIITLASYKNVFFQSKRVQNEIVSRQEHWRAEGGLECAYSNLFNTGSVGFGCDNDFGASVVVQALSGKEQLLSSTYNAGHHSTTVSKIFAISNGLPSGALLSTAGIVTQGALHFGFPELTIQSDECVTVRHKNGIATKNDNDSSIVIHDGDGCSFNYTYVDPDSGQQQEVEDGILQDNSLKPFEDIFNVTHDEWTTVRDSADYNFYVIDTNSTPDASAVATSSVENCADAVQAAIEARKAANIEPIRIWVEGSCDLVLKSGINAAEATLDTSGVLLLVHNGIVNTSGSGNGDFKGVLFQYNHDFEVVDGESSFVNDKNMNFTGGVILDMDNYTDADGNLVEQYATLKNSMSIVYDESIMNTLFNRETKPSWMQGSWHDF